jgi:hypothetical protein
MRSVWLHVCKLMPAGKRACPIPAAGSRQAKMMRKHTECCGTRWGGWVGGVLRIMQACTDTGETDAVSGAAAAACAVDAHCAALVFGLLQLRGYAMLIITDTGASSTPCCALSHPSQDALLRCRCCAHAQLCCCCSRCCATHLDLFSGFAMNCWCVIGVNPAHRNRSNTHRQALKAQVVLQQAMHQACHELSCLKKNYAQKPQWSTRLAVELCLKQTRVPYQAVPHV